MLLVYTIWEYFVNIQSLDVVQKSLRIVQMFFNSDFDTNVSKYIPENI